MSGDHDRAGIMSRVQFAKHSHRTILRGAVSIHHRALQTRNHSRWRGLPPRSSIPQTVRVPVSARADPGRHIFEGRDPERAVERFLRARRKGLEYIASIFYSAELLYRVSGISTSPFGKRRVGGWTSVRPDDWFGMSDEIGRAHLFSRCCRNLPRNSTGRLAHREARRIRRRPAS
jgi:hypothetical protein